MQEIENHERLRGDWPRYATVLRTNHTINLCFIIHVNFEEFSAVNCPLMCYLGIANYHINTEIDYPYVVALNNQ